MLLAMNTTMAGMAFQMVTTNQENSYAQTFVILSAAYTFYCLITAIVNAVKFRNAPNPIHSAIRDLTLVGAVMSIYLLQTTMIETFGTEDDGVDFRQIMNAVTGGCVIVFVLFISMLMLFKGQKNVKKINNKE